MSKVKILYVDDETDLLDLAATFFEDENLPIETCPDYHRALELLDANEYDLVISDAKLPIGSGPELFRYLNSRGFKGKKILVSGNVQSPLEIKEIGYDDVVLKPIDFSLLIDRVKVILGKL